MKKMLVVIALLISLLNLVPITPVQAQEEGLNCPTLDEAIVWLNSQSFGEIIADWNWDISCLIKAGEHPFWFEGLAIIGQNAPDTSIHSIRLEDAFWTDQPAWVNGNPSGASCPQEAWFCLLIAADN